MWLTGDTFRTVVASTPLVSIDLVVQDAEGAVLLGQRLNRPAQGFWFVPGGRIMKNETLDAAFRRLTADELGRPFEGCEARLLELPDPATPDLVDRHGVEVVELAPALTGRRHQSRCFEDV